VRRNLGKFTQREKAMWLEISLNLMCWPEIIEKFKLTFLSVAKKTAKAGFDEWLIEIERRIK
jgi:hypothetical protein